MARPRKSSRSKRKPTAKPRRRAKACTPKAAMALLRARSIAKRRHKPKRMWRKSLDGCKTPRQAGQVAYVAMMTGGRKKKGKRRANPASAMTRASRRPRSRQERLGHALAKLKSPETRAKLKSGVLKAGSLTWRGAKAAGRGAVVAGKLTWRGAKATGRGLKSAYGTAKCVKQCVKVCKKPAATTAANKGEQMALAISNPTRKSTMARKKSKRYANPIKFRNGRTLTPESCTDEAAWKIAGENRSRRRKHKKLAYGIKTDKGVCTKESAAVYRRGGAGFNWSDWVNPAWL